MKLQDFYGNFQLTDGQRTLVEKLDHFLETKNQNIFLLKGYAGTGKTFITKGLTDYLTALGRHFWLAAPTGKAAKVLKNKTGKNASTIHRQIYDFGNLVEYRDENNPETFRWYTEFKPNENPVNTVYIIDEASMLSDQYSDNEFVRFGSGYLLKDLLNFINIDQNDHNKKIIFIGDNAQLPPVKMSFSPALDTDYLRKNYNLQVSEFELTDVVRQKAESGVLNNAFKIRQGLLKNEFNQLNFDFNYPDLTKITEQEAVDCYLKLCDYKVSDKVILVAYSNADVQKYNETVREYLFPNQSFICRGDKIMSLRNRDLDVMYINNGDFGFVRHVAEIAEKRVITLRKKLGNGQVEVKDVELYFRDVNVGFRNEKGDAVFVDIKILENILYSMSAQLESDVQKALYIDFCIRHPDLTYRHNKKEFKAALLEDPYFNALPVKFGYAVTCHKAQGSEWENVIVKCDAHQNKLSRDYFRWIYTAITRTSNQLYLINPPQQKLGAGIQISGFVSSTEQNTFPNVEQSQNSIAPELAYSSQDLPTISKKILAKVEAILLPINVKVISVETKHYHDLYNVQIDEKIERFKVFYNAKNKISSVMGIDMRNELLIQLKQLENQLVTSLTSITMPSSSIELSQDFLNEFHARVQSIIEPQTVQISQVKELNWCLRYHFEKDGQSATVDIYYNGRHQFTKMLPVLPLSTNKAFVAEIVQLLTLGLS